MIDLFTILCVTHITSETIIISQSLTFYVVLLLLLKLYSFIPTEKLYRKMFIELVFYIKTTPTNVKQFALIISKFISLTRLYY